MARKYKEAKDVLTAGLDLNQDNPKLEIQFYNTLAETTYRLKQYPESYSWFDKCLAKDPDNAMALNNYAYYLSERNEKLDKAEAMSKKSLELDSANASYKDTYGWILYRNGKYNEAAIWVKKAMVKDGHSADVNEHLGDIMYKLGNTDEAVQYWKKAREYGSESPNIDKMISDKKLYE